MKKITVMLIILMLIGIGLLSGCNKKTDVDSYKDQILGRWGASDYWIQFNTDNTCYTYSSSVNNSTQYTYSYSITDNQIIFYSQGSIINSLSYIFIGKDKLQITTEKEAIYTLPRFNTQTNNTNIKPSCSLSVDINSGNSPLTVNFLMNASDIDGSISFWALDINNDESVEYSGIGNPPSGKQYTYSNPGTYTARLTVTDNEEAIDYKIVIITVYSPSSPAIISVDIGDTVKGKYLEVTVLFYEFANSCTFSVGGMQFTENTVEGKTFVIIKVHFHQIGDDSQYVGPTDFWLIDHNNYKYDYDYRTYSLDGGLTSTNLYKNLNAEGKILYEIPKEAYDLKVQYNFATFWDSPKITEWIIT